MALDELQFEYRGLVFGEGTDFHVNRAEGFEGYEVRSSDSDQPRGDGGIRGLDYVAPRTLAFELAIIEYTGGETTYEDYWREIRKAFRPSRELDYPLTFKRPGCPERFIQCRPVQLVRVEEYQRYNIVGFPPVVLRAVDPRIYSTQIHTGNVPVYVPNGGGVDFDIDFAEDFTTTPGTQIEFVAHNDGTANAYPLIRFYGPTVGTVTGVSLTNTTTGQSIEISATMATGQALWADMQAIVTASNALGIHMDQASRYGDWALPREPFALAPGSNTLRFEVEGTSVDASCRIQWRDTWLD
jgi:hypothetical protein